MDKTALFNLSYGMYIIATKDGERLCGCTANSAIQVTAEPATIAISINVNNYTNKCIKQTGQFTLNILGVNNDPLLIGSFGFRSSKDCDKFENVNYEIIDGLPILKDANSYFICKVKNTLEVGTHTIFVADITDCKKQNDDIPMTYSYYHNVIKGKSPKNAPTYVS